jgi:hypothetical protein
LAKASHFAAKNDRLLQSHDEHVMSAEGWIKIDIRTRLTTPIPAIATIAKENQRQEIKVRCNSQQQHEE